ncbi:hypothetical protein HID58_093201 [Brassica napus]|uniref:Uncharacterized protein n=1 Tax=Brassica napus TaxID=3708 RepID=A0ABQ7XC12_BRANA|nr:hypothetical protein HID58_093201 [Brassica napus]
MAKMEILFEKYLTTADLSWLNIFLFGANEEVVEYFGLATVFARGAEMILRVQDEEGRPWEFGFLDVNIQFYQLTNGWSNYVKEKQLGVGDIVFLQRIFTDSSRLFLGFSRREAALEGTSSDKLKEVNSPLPLRSHVHSVTEFDPVLVLSCAANQESGERYFISYISTELGQSGSFGRAFSQLENSIQASQVPTFTFIDKHQYMKGGEVILAKNIVSNVCLLLRLSHLRDEFFSKISGEEKVTVDACDTKLGFLRDRFLSKKVLVVLDSVSSARDAEFLVGGFGWFSGGHTLILTSRNRQVLIQCTAKEIYEIQKLSEHESLHVCSQFAAVQNWKERTSLVSELVNYASGIPLALRALGSSLQNNCIVGKRSRLLDPTDIVDVLTNNSNLERLKRIILSHSRQLTKFPRLSKAKNLEHIDLEGCTSLVKVNSSILHHQKLTFLNLKDCSRLRSMPATIHLEALKVLNLSGCSELEDLQDFSPNLSELYLAGTAITEIPSSIGGLTRLVTLDLENCNRLQHLPPEISNLKAVVSLSAKRPASSKESRDLASFVDVAPPYRRYRLKRCIEAVILSLRKRKREKIFSIATNLSEVMRASVSTWGFFGLPERPGEPECAYYMKTGGCKFGSDCKFHHPRHRETHIPGLSSFSHPSQPGNPVCASYYYTGNCSSGATCMFDHPSSIPTHRDTSFVASLTPNLNPRGFSSSIGDSSIELVEAATKKRRIHHNTSPMVSETPLLNVRGFVSSIGDASSKLVEAPTSKVRIAARKKQRIHKNTTSMASETPHLNPPELSSSPGALSSEHVKQNKD